MPGIAVVSNPKSGQNRRNPQLIHRLAYVLGDHGVVAQPESLPDLAQTARDFRQRDISVVCINGGDGTLHKVLSALVVAYADGATGDALRRVKLPHIALLKGGTVNTMARNIGLRRGGHHLLGQVVECVHSGGPLPTVERNALVVGGRHAGFLFGTGVLYKFMKMYESGRQPGPIKALRLVAQVCLSAAVGGSLASELFAPQPAQVTLDGEEWAASEYAAIALGTMNDIGLGFKVFHAAADNPDHLHALGFHTTPYDVLRRMHRIYLGRPTELPDVVDRVGKRLVIRGEAARGFMMDGDFVDAPAQDNPEHHDLVVEAGPRVRFIVP